MRGGAETDFDDLDDKLWTVSSVDDDAKKNIILSGCTSRKVWAPLAFILIFAATILAGEEHDEQVVEPQRIKGNKREYTELYSSANTVPPV